MNIEQNLTANNICSIDQVLWTTGQGSFVYTAESTPRRAKMPYKQYKEVKLGDLQPETH